MSVGQVGWWGRKDEVCGFASHFGALAAGSRQARKVAGGLVSRSRVVDDDELGD